MNAQEYVDGEETREWEILKDIDRREAVRLYPDFDVAYLRAAYITPSIDDHHMADTDLLKEGLEQSIRKSRLLARICCWHCWNANTNEFAYGSASTAVRCAVQSLVAAGGPPREAKGSEFQAFVLLTELTRYVDRKVSEDLYWKGPRGKLGESQKRDVLYTAESCVRSFPQVAHWATDSARELILPKL